MTEFAEKRDELIIPTLGQGTIDITRAVEAWLETMRVVEGLLTLFVRQKTISLGLGDRPRAKAAKVSTHAKAPAKATPRGSIRLAVPVTQGRTVLGAWQSIFLFEQDFEPSDRAVALHFVGTLG